MQVKANLIEQKEKINWNKSLSKERSELNKHLLISEDMLKCIIKVTNAMKDNKMVEKEATER